MKKSKISLPFKVFVSLMALNLVMMGFAVMIVHGAEAKEAMASFGIMIFSFIFIGFMIYIKDFALKDHWKKVSPAIKILFWFMFLGNGISAVSRFMDAFIYN
jgi:hypothetical protein